MTQNEALKVLKVLYVEDEDIARLSIGTFLRKQVGQLLLASNGSEGLQLYQENQPDVVITDLEMPIMNGMEMILKIRQLDHAIPIIVTTAYDVEAHQCRDANCTIQKPISFLTLLKSMQDCVVAQS